MTAHFDTKNILSMLSLCYDVIIINTYTNTPSKENNNGALYFELDCLEM